MELFLKLLQDSNSLLMKCIQKFLDTQVENDENSNSRGNKIGTLKDCEIDSTFYKNVNR